MDDVLTIEKPITDTWVKIREPQYGIFAGYCEDDCGEDCGTNQD